MKLVEGDDLGGAGEAGAVDCKRPVGELHGDLAGDLTGELRGALLGAIGDEDGGCALLDEMTRGQFGHLARADDEDGLAAQAAEDLAGEVDGDGGDGDGGAADLGLGADALGDREGALEERFERGGDGADLAGDGVGLLDLAEDLRLADDHGVERAGDAEEMADGLAIAELVEVGLEGGGGDSKVLVQEAEDVWGIAIAGWSWMVRNSTRLQVERMRASRMPGCWVRVRVASARRVEGMARRSRTSMGAVVWLTPSRTSAPWGRDRCAQRGAGADSEAEAGGTMARRGATWRGWLAHGVENLYAAETVCRPDDEHATRTAPERYAALRPRNPSATPRRRIRRLDDHMAKRGNHLRIGESMRRRGASPGRAQQPMTEADGHAGKSEEEHEVCDADRWSSSGRSQSRGAEPEPWPASSCA